MRWISVHKHVYVCQVQAHYELLQELSIDVPPMEFAAYKTMEGDVLLMQDAVYTAEANKELNIQRFKVGLMLHRAAMLRSGGCCHSGH